MLCSSKRVNSGLEFLTRSLWDGSQPAAVLPRGLDILWEGKRGVKADVPGLLDEAIGYFAVLGIRAPR